MRPPSSKGNRSETWDQDLEVGEILDYHEFFSWSIRGGLYVCWFLHVMKKWMAVVVVFFGNVRAMAILGWIEHRMIRYYSNEYTEAMLWLHDVKNKEEISSDMIWSDMIVLKCLLNEHLWLSWFFTANSQKPQVSWGILVRESANSLKNHNKAGINFLSKTFSPKKRGARFKKWWFLEFITNKFLADFDCFRWARSWFYQPWRQRQLPLVKPWRGGWTVQQTTVVWVCIITWTGKLTAGNTQSHGGFFGWKMTFPFLKGVDFQVNHVSFQGCTSLCVGYSWYKHV